jgi:hypothetical protein
MRIVRIAAILAMGMAGPLASQTGAPAPSPGIAAKAPGAGRQILNPESVAARLMLATPEQRERALAKLPPERQTEIRKQLAWFDGLTKAEQDVQIRRLDRFASLPPDQQVILRLQVAALAKLPPARRQALRRALVNLQRLPQAQRAVRMNNPAFKSRFSPEELSIVEDLAGALLLPQAQPPIPASPK